MRVLRPALVLCGILAVSACAELLGFLEPPPAPSNLTASAAGPQVIQLNWIDNSEFEIGFHVSRCEGPGCSDFADIATVDAGVTTYISGPLQESTTYSYRVRAFNPGGESDYSNVASASVGWNDDFEEYSPGSWPASWIPDANAHETATNHVVAGVAYSGSQSLQMLGQIGGCWSAIAYRPIGLSPPFTVEVAIRRGTESLFGCHPIRPSVGLRQCCSWTLPYRGVFEVPADGTVRSAGGNTLLTLNPATWSKLKVLYERPTSTTVQISYWVDGQYRGQETFPAHPAEAQIGHLNLEVGEGSSWFDDVKVY